MDKISKDRRSWNMSRIRSTHSKPEIAVRSMLHRLGYRFRLHRNDLPGRPDVVLPKYRTVVFIHGCFWHRHRGCKLAYTPKTRVEFWMRKLDGNMMRDVSVQKALISLGWKVIVIWECQLKAEKKTEALLLRKLTPLPWRQNVKGLSCGSR